MNVARRLIERRKAAGLTKKEVAHRAGRSYAYVRAIEAEDNKPPTWSLIADWARAVETSTDYLLGLTDDPAPAAVRELPPGASELLTTARALSDVSRSLLCDIADALLEHEREIRANIQHMTIAAALVELSTNEQTADELFDVLRGSRTDPEAARALVKQMFPIAEQTPQGEVEQG